MQTSIKLIFTSYAPAEWGNSLNKNCICNQYYLPCALSLLPGRAQTRTRKNGLPIAHATWGNGCDGAENAKVPILSRALQLGGLETRLTTDIGESAAHCK